MEKDKHNQESDTPQDVRVLGADDPVACEAVEALMQRSIDRAAAVYEKLASN